MKIKMVSLEDLVEYIIYYSFYTKKQLYYVYELGAVVYIINHVYKELKGTSFILEKPDEPFHDYLYPVYYKIVAKYGMGLVGYKQIPWYLSSRCVVVKFPQINYVLDVLNTCERYKILNALKIIDGV